MRSIHHNHGGRIARPLLPRAVRALPALLALGALAAPAGAAGPWYAGAPPGGRGHVLRGSLYTLALLGDGAPAPEPPRRAARPARAAPAQVVTPPRPRRTDRISLSFSGVDVRDILAQIADYARVDIAMTPGATGIVTINLRGRTPDEAIRLVSAAAGMSVAKVGRTYLVGPAAEVQKAVSEFGQAEILPLRYVAPADAVAMLGRVAPAVRAEAMKNAVILSGLPDDLAAARRAVGEMDVPPIEAPAKTETDILSLRAMEPEAAERVLREAFPALKISRQDRTLIMVGAAPDLQAAARAIQALDVEPPKLEAPPEMVVYRLKYLNATRAMEALNKVFGGGTGTEGGGRLKVAEAPEAVAPPAANFNPLGGGFGGSGSSGGSGGGGFGGGGGGGGGQSSTSTGTGGAGGAGGGASAQPFSRATRLILIGARTDLDAALKLLAETDLPQPLVRIEAMIVEASTTDIKNLGLQWDFTNTQATFAVTGGRPLRFNQVPNTQGDQQNNQTGEASFSVALQALVDQSRARLLSSPNISVVDNEDASIFVGELRRFRGTTTVAPNVGTVQAVDAVPIGIALLVRPRIHPDGAITLKVHPVVSSISAFVGDLPQTATREADTTVRLREGEELVIGGLNSNDLTRTERRVPILGDIPILGELFRSRGRDSRKTELVVVIRAYPVMTDTAPMRDFRPGDQKP